MSACVCVSVYDCVYVCVCLCVSACVCVCVLGVNLRSLTESEVGNFFDFNFHFLSFFLSISPLLSNVH